MIKFSYYLMCWYIIKEIRYRIIFKVLDSGKDFQIFPMLTASQLYNKLKYIYTPGLKKVAMLSEMKGHFSALKSLKRELKIFLSTLK